MNTRDDKDTDVVVQGDYKRISTKMYIGISFILVIASILFYPNFKTYLSAGTPNLNLKVVLPWVIVTVIAIMVMSAIPILLRMSSKRKEAEISRMKEQAELLNKYYAELDATNAMYDPMALTPPENGEQPPTYKPPVNSSNDPYSAKPQGFSAQQARQGYPQAPALKQLVEPSDPSFRPEQETSEQFIEFRKDMASKGITGSDVAMYTKFQQFNEFKSAMKVQGVVCTDFEMFTKFQQYQHFQKMQAQTLAQKVMPNTQMGLFPHSAGFSTDGNGFTGSSAK